MAAWLHQLGIRLLRYLDDWLILASSWEEALWAREQVLSLCLELGVQVNMQRSSLVRNRLCLAWAWG